MKNYHPISVISAIEKVFERIIYNQLSSYLSENNILSQYQMNEGVVSKETVVLRRWGSSIQKFGFINGVDNVNWPPYRDSNG